MPPSRPGARRPELPSAALTTGEYLTLVLLLGGAIIATALFVAWLYEQRGMLAPGSAPITLDHGTGPDAPPA